MDWKIFKNLYLLAIKDNKQLKRFAGFFILAILIIATANYFTVAKAEVFLFAVCMFLFVYFAFLLEKLARARKGFERMIFRILALTTVLCLCASLVSFELFLYTGKPDFYTRWFPKITQPKDSTHRPSDTAAIMTEAKNHLGTITKKEFFVQPGQISMSNLKRVEQNLQLSASTGTIKLQISFLADSTKIEKLSETVFRYNYHGKVHVFVNDWLCTQSKLEIPISADLTYPQLRQFLYDELNSILALEMDSLCQQIKTCLPK
jgi:hypothetical protein